MKKTLLFVAVMGLALSSCKKVYRCECKETSSDPTFTGDTYSFSTPKMKKKDAETHCSSLESTYTWYNANFDEITVTEKCELKD